MDKYTVDLDKVLNDFEYSEYSLESSKVNKNLPTESTAHSSYNPSYTSSSRVDTNVKHSITNVFHSLNEYLNTEIKPKPPPEIKNKSKFTTSTVSVAPDVYPNLKETEAIDLIDNSIPVIEDLGITDSIKHSLNIECLINKDNTHNTPIDVITDEPILKNVVSSSNVNNYNEIENETEIILVELKEELSINKEKKTETNYKEELHNNFIEATPNTIEFNIKEPYRIDFDPASTQGIFDDFSVSIIDKKDTHEDVNNSSHERVDENSLVITETEIKQNTVKDGYLKTIDGDEMSSKTTDSMQESDNEKEKNLDLEIVIPEIEINTKIKPISSQEKVDNESREGLSEECTENFHNNSETNIENIPKVNSKSEDDFCSKVGFDNAIEIDESNLDEYFDELEKEFENFNPHSDSKSHENLPISGKSIIVESDAEPELKNNSKRDNETYNRETVAKELPEIVCETVSVAEVFDEVTVKLPDESKVEDSEQQRLEEIDKNSRPDNLALLGGELEISKREIDLIGAPGSTPYNNVYIDKELPPDSGAKPTENNVQKVRSLSPTYSDVSTESISSTSVTSETAYDQAVSTGTAQEVATVPIENVAVVEDVNVATVNTIEGDSTREVENSNSLGDVNESSIQQMEEIESNVSVSSVTSEMEPEVSGNSFPGTEWLGKQAPLWIPDANALSCLHCDMKFTLMKRRHHCRACGLVLCSKCCSLKYRLEYLEADARVCKRCYDILNRDTNSSSGSEISQDLSPARGLGQPNPNNPLEYCSTIPPMQQISSNASATPSVLVPVSVLKRKGSNKSKSNKSVMFCDGIRPGSDLTNLDTDFNYNEGKSKKPEKVNENKSNPLLDPTSMSFIPSDEHNLPPTVTILKNDINHTDCANNTNVVETLRNETLIFALQTNLFVHVRIINMDCCINKVAWCFSTEGLINVGQDEIVILLEFKDEENAVPKDIFYHINNVYADAVKGSSVKELGISSHNSSTFLGSKNHPGFVYIRPSFQCLQKVIVPKEPYLIGILIHRWETPWAKLFPLRLILRLGAEYRYYPSPIISTRERDSVFVEIGHTIINLLADFRNFAYTLPQIRGLTIHMEDKDTTVTIPVNRYDQVLKSLGNSSESTLAFSGNFSSAADSHLVCIQDTQSDFSSYSTHAINIHNNPRKVTGASFIVFNGALKSSSGLTAKSTIVEDGLMIQILPEHMLQIRESLRSMKNYTIRCGCINATTDETVTIIWGEPDVAFNIGITSPIDNLEMNGIPSIRVHSGKDHTCNSGSRLIRWTEVFVVQSGEDSNRNQEPVDISKISESISKATCQGLVKYLDLLVSNNFYKIAIRATLHVENVSYLAGSNNIKLPPIYMKSLDNELIPVLHRITSNNITENAIVLELIFRILNV